MQGLTSGNAPAISAVRVGRAIDHHDDLFGYADDSNPPLSLFSNSAPMKRSSWYGNDEESSRRSGWRISFYLSGSD